MNQKKTIKISGEISVQGIWQLQQVFQNLLRDQDVNSIVFSLNSNGGYGGPELDELTDTIFTARAKKTIIAFATGDCCSAAYQIASACNVIFAHAEARIGGIGSVIDMGDIPPCTKKPVPPAAEVDAKRARFKEIIGETLAPYVDNENSIFYQIVARYRGLPLERVQQIANNKHVYSAPDALRLGLIDLII